MKVHPLKSIACFIQWQIWCMMAGRTRRESVSCCVLWYSGETILFRSAASLLELSNTSAISRFLKALYFTPFSLFSEQGCERFSMFTIHLYWSVLFLLLFRDTILQTKWDIGLHLIPTPKYASASLQLGSYL